jgi:hypothetical protein
MPEKDPFQPLDADSRALARQLIDTATSGALATTNPETGAPNVTRIAIGTDTDGTPVTLISGLASHTPALRADPRCALMLGEPPEKGDPLAFPRLMLDCRAAFIERTDPAFAPLRDHFLAQRPKSKLYIDLPDFAFARLEIDRATLNGGFGKAFRLAAADLTA